MEKMTSYKKNGYEFELHHREGDFAIFVGKMEGSECQNWEVIEIQSHNGRQINESYIAPTEFPPSNNQWGMKGWTALSKEDAHRIFEKHKK